MEFALASPYLFTFLTLCVGLPMIVLGATVLEVLLKLIFRLPSTLYIRTMRVLQVWGRGWPPEHLDADGDWKPQPKITT